MTFPTTESPKLGLPPRLLTIEEAAEFLGYSVGTLHQQRHHDRAPGNLGVKIGGLLRYVPEDLAKFVRSAQEARDAS